MKLHEPNLDMLSAYLDGQLSPDAARSMEQHLHGCLVCARALARERRLIGSLDDARSVSPPPDFVNAVMGRVAQYPAHRPATPVPWRSMARWAAAASVVLGAGGLAVLAWILGSGALEGGDLVAGGLTRVIDVVTGGVAAVRDFVSPAGVLLEEAGKMLWRLASLAVNSSWLVQLTLLLLTVSLNYAFTRLVLNYQRRH